MPLAGDGAVEWATMSSRASPGTTTAVVIAAAVFGFGGGAVAGNLDDTSADGPPAAPTTASSPAPTTPASSVSLTAEQTSVSANDRINMAGTLDPAVGGVELIVERSLDGGKWSAFPDATNPVTVTTGDDGSFSTYVVTGRTGQNQFRVVGQVGEQRLESQPVTVTIS